MLCFYNLADSLYHCVGSAMNFDHTRAIRSLAYEA